MVLQYTIRNYSKTKGLIKLITFLETVKELSFLLIFISSAIYCRQLKLTKWKRKLSKGEMTMYIITSITLPTYAIIYLVLLLGT
ncbi:hypothetical protein JOC94_001230 [Bacillus thermophilus]|uniref:Uncharacterized protein n=1 Tax=Siminovitchia thermophila TaxID=1245522 RepID=A0ABS2R3P9_9BACI|nr:hypothetical protein [Siminovitchia thermophila]